MQVPQDIVHDSAHVGPLSDQRLEQIAFDIFCFQYPASFYYDNGFSAARSECRKIATKLAERLQVYWTAQNAVEQLTEQLVHLGYGKRTLTTEQRRTVEDYASSCIEDFVPLFTGDQSGSWQHTPEDEPDDSTLEDLKGKVQ